MFNRAQPDTFQQTPRRAGIIADYRYSDILNGSSIIWNEQTIDTLFDLGPDHYILGSKMPMQRIAKPKNRAALISYLRRTTTQGTSE